MPTLEALFSPEQKARLYAAIPKRYACRAYASAPTVGDWAALSYWAERYALPGARLILMRVSDALFTGTLLGPGRVTGCTAVAAVAVTPSFPLSRVHAGILGEAFSLEAVAMGLACCWLTGSYRKKLLAPPLRPEEALLGVIALGRPEHPDAPDTRKRKSLERLCAGNPRQWPEELRLAASAVQLAPSAMNLQPWQMSMTTDRFIIDAGDRAQLDLGIALCHAELALRSPHRWRFGETRRDPAAWAEALQQP